MATPIDMFVEYFLPKEEEQQPPKNIYAQPRRGPPPRRPEPPCYRNSFVETLFKMVGNSPASQGSWSAGTAPPSSSTPPESEAQNTNVPANLHGAIGEHRRSSRSSSVSSGGSGGNTADSMEGLRQGRLNSLTSQPQQVNGELSQEQNALLVLQQNLPKPKDQIESQGNPGFQSMTPADQPHTSDSISPLSTELVSQLNLVPGPRANSDNDHMFNYMMPSQPMNHQANFQNQRQMSANGAMFQNRQGPNRPIVGLSSNNFSTPGSETEVCRLLGEPLPGSVYNRGAQRDFNSHMSFPNAQDTFPDESAGAVGGHYPTAPSRPFHNSDGGGFNYMGSHQFFNQSATGNQFQPGANSFFNNGQGSNQHMMHGMNGMSGSGNYSPNGFNGSASRFYQNAQMGRQNNGYYSPQSSNAQGYGSQDFSMPPPNQPWPPTGASNNNANNDENDAEQQENMTMTCEGCQKFFKWPHVLDCLHVFCFSCMVKSFRPDESVIVCTACTRRTSVPEGPCHLRLDYQMCIKMLEKKKSPYGCTMCSKDAEAISVCYNCTAYLCSECNERHKAMLHFSGHQLKPSTKLIMVSGEYKPTCTVHTNEPENKYCVSCETMFCEKCLPKHEHPENTSSNNHNLTEAYNIVVPRLMNWMEDTNIKWRDVQELLKKFPDMKPILDMKKRAVKRQIDEYTDYCKNVVEQNRALALDLVDSAHAQLECKVCEMMAKVTNLSKELEAAAIFNHRTIKEGSMETCMKNLVAMENAYKRIIEEHASYSTLNDLGIVTDLKFTPNYPGTNDLISDNFHAMTYKLNDEEFNVQQNQNSHRGDARGRGFMDFPGSSDNPDCNYQRWSAAPDSMAISTWNSGAERSKYVSKLSRWRTRTSYIHVFGEYGRGEYSFTEPSGQAYLKDGSYVICDTNNHRIVYYNANHQFVRSIGQPPNLPPLSDDQDQRNNGLRNKGFTRQEGYLYFPNRVAICPITQHIVATERPPSHDIQIFTIEGEFVRCFGGNILQHPRGVTVDERGVIIVVECKVMKLVMFDHEGNFLVSHSLTKDLEFPNDVAAKNNKIYISDNRGHCVQVFNYDAEFLQRIGSDNVTYFPIGVSINHKDQIVVTDNHNTFNITVFEMDGTPACCFESITKHAQCHNVAVHPTRMELMLTTKDCNVYFFNYDPEAQHPPQGPLSRNSPGSFNPRRGRGNGNGNGNGNAIGNGSSFYN